MYVCQCIYPTCVHRLHIAPMCRQMLKIPLKFRHRKNNFFPSKQNFHLLLVSETPKTNYHRLRHRRRGQFRRSFGSNLDLCFWEKMKKKENKKVLSSSPFITLCFFPLPLALHFLLPSFILPFFSYFHHPSFSHSFPPFLLRYLPSSLLSLFVSLSLFTSFSSPSFITYPSLPHFFLTLPSNLFLPHSPLLFDSSSPPQSLSSPSSITFPSLIHSFFHLVSPSLLTPPSPSLLSLTPPSPITLPSLPHSSLIHHPSFSPSLLPHPSPLPHNPSLTPKHKFLASCHLYSS